MDLGIMQPYFLPYLGYFQLLNKVDRFVIYDNIQFSKKGWIQRNRILLNGEPGYFGLPLKKASDYADIAERELASSWDKERAKLLARVRQNYKKAPQFSKVFALLEDIVDYPSNNLFEFLANSLKVIASYLDIGTPLVCSSCFSGNEQFRAEQRVLDLCQRLQANRYINPIGGVGLYSHEYFAEQQIQLTFLEYLPRDYWQGTPTFFSHLSVLDVLMWNEKSQVKEMLSSDFELYEGSHVPMD